MPANKISDTRELAKLTRGEAFKAFFVFGEIIPKSDKNDKTYYDVTAADSFGTIKAKVWADGAWIDRSGAEAANIKPEDIPALVGKTVGVDGVTADYKGVLQFNFKKITLLDQEKYPPSQYMPHSPVAFAKLEKRFNALINDCSGEAGEFLKQVFTGEILRKFREWPAAKGHHHAYANGLIEHTVSVAECARSMALSMTNSEYDVDKDIVIAGALLHDIGKINSYKMDFVPGMTTEGVLIDHVVQGYEIFSRLADEYKLSEHLRLHLGHILLSHHGMREYGSPVLPATPEALIVSAADDLDFKLYCWADSTKALTDEQPVSEWNNSAQRRFWKK